VDRSFAGNAHSFVDKLTAIDEIFNILMVALVSSLVQVLQHRSGELIFANFEGSLSEVDTDGVSAHLDHKA